jgi:GDP-4-dehydro-6-deoxy-D-mannose reductase
MKILITGAAGFVGNHLLNLYKTIPETELFITKMQNEEINYEGNIYDLDILNKNEVKSLINKIMPDKIVHLAAQSSVSMSWQQPSKTIEINVIGVINLLEAVKSIKNDIKILLIGSGEEYGYINEGELPIDENNTLRPGNVYAVSKATQNMIGNVYSKAYNMNIVIARPFNHIGPGQKSIFVVSDFCRQVAEIEKGKKEPIIYVGNIEVKRDFTDVRDVVYAYKLLLEKGIRGEIYNIGSGVAIKISELLKILLELSSVKFEVKVNKSKLRPVDIAVIETDINKIYKHTGWKPNITIRNSLRDTLNYWREIV